MSKTKETQRRITSVQNTQKITQAMEMVAATKMKRAIDFALKTRRYSNVGWSIAQDIVFNKNRGNGEMHPFLKKDPFKDNCSDNETKKIGVVVITSNRGLCGGFNSSIVNKAHRLIKRLKRKQGGDLEVDVITIGKKGHLLNKYYGYNISAEFEKEDITNDFQEIVAPTKMAIDKYLSGEYCKVYLVYTNYVSAFKQVPRAKQVLPIVDIDEEDPHIGRAEGMFAEKSSTARNEDESIKDCSSCEYLFEPNPKEVLEKMLPRLVEIHFFQALLETNASEHSARMVTMHQATDASKEMIEELRLSYNKERQANITREISEISSSAEALN
ncbi:MAG: ATP synthase F1 subunit gamma [Patescibacteria group bacterium]|jgi:F-type H+-transporting ATPase subunit gamma|nr:ATP synthase F1 subunit gamma [Patescibacteria group bacterium]